MDSIKLLILTSSFCIELKFWHFIKIIQLTLLKHVQWKLIWIIKTKAKIIGESGLVSGNVLWNTAISYNIWFAVKQDEQKLTYISLKILLLRLNPKQKTSIHFEFSLSVEVLSMRSASHKMSVWTAGPSWWTVWEDLGGTAKQKEMYH